MKKGVKFYQPFMLGVTLMDRHSKNQYLKELREEYLKTRSKRGRGQFLDEAEKRTGLDRKYLIKKLGRKSCLDRSEGERKRRRDTCDGPVKAALAICWKIFDHPCGQRLESLLKAETTRLRDFGELRCSDEVAAKLTKICCRTIDEKLKHTKEVESQARKYHKKLKSCTPWSIWASRRTTLSRPSMKRSPNK